LRRFSRWSRLKKTKLITCKNLPMGLRLLPKWVVWAAQNSSKLMGIKKAASYRRQLSTAKLTNFLVE